MNTVIVNTSPHTLMNMIVMGRWSMDTITFWGYSKRTMNIVSANICALTTADKRQHRRQVT